MSVRAQHLRDHYPHSRGQPLVTTAQAAAIMRLTTRTFLRRVQGAGIEPVRRGGHGRMLWSMDDLQNLLDIESQRCHSGG